MRDATVFDPHQSGGIPHNWLIGNPDNRCFDQVVPRAVALQEAARFHTPDRSYFAKYPGDTGKAIRALCEEMLARMDIAAAADVTPQAPPPVPQSAATSDVGVSSGSGTDDPSHATAASSP